MLEDLERELASSVLAPHAAWLTEHARRAIDVRRVEDVSGRSRLGGAPDLPRGMEWPRIGTRPYRFVAQLDLAALPREAMPLAVRDALPMRGLLSLFVADDPTGELDPRAELDWTSPDYAIAILSEPDADLVAATPPVEVSFGTSVPISFAPTLDLPHDRDQVASWPTALDDDAAYEARHALRRRLHDDHLFGYPTHCTLAYDPTPKGQVPLASFFSDDALSWCWHDGDCLMLFVDPSQIRIGRFSLGADCG